MADGGHAAGGGRLSTSPTRDLALLAVSRGATQLGNMATVVAVLLVVRPLGPGAVALVLGAELLAVVALAPLAGLLVDRVPARRLIVAANLVQAAAIGSASLVVTLQGGRLLSLLVPLLVVVGAMQALAGPAQSALVPWVVGEERSARGYSALAVAGNLGFLLGLPLGGLLVGTVGAPWALRVDATTFLLQAALVTCLTARRAPRLRSSATGAGPGPGRTAEVLAGVTWLRTDRVLLVTTAGLAVGLVSVTTVNVAEVYVVVDVLGADELTYGLVAAAWAAASLLSSWLAGRLVDPVWTGRWVLLGCVVTGVGVCVAGVGGAALSLPLLVVGWLVGGAGNGATVVASSALVRVRTPDERRGRVFAAVQVLYTVANLSALVLGAGLVARLGATETLLLCGTASAVTGTLALVALRAAGEQGHAASPRSSRNAASTTLVTPGTLDAPAVVPGRGGATEE